MRLMLCLLATSALALAAAPVSGQVYKCKGQGGATVYSQNPCGASAEPVKVRSTKAATRTAGEQSTRDAVFRSTDLSDIAIAERNCVSAANSSIYGPVNSRTADYQRQIASLNREAGTAKNNLAGATFQSGIRNQIAGLQASLSAERQAADASMSSARQRCADDRRAKEDAVKKTYEARAEQHSAAGK